MFHLFGVQPGHIYVTISSQYQHKEQTRSEAPYKTYTVWGKIHHTMQANTNYSTSTIPRASAINSTKYTLWYPSTTSLNKNIIQGVLMSLVNILMNKHSQMNLYTTVEIRRLYSETFNVKQRYYCIVVGVLMAP